jgi:hypothetical protein
VTLPSDPLKNQRHERFAQLVALGATYVRGWIEAAPQGKRPSAKSASVQGHRTMQRPDVRARVQFLQQGRKEAHTARLPLVSATDLKSAMKALTGEIQALYDRLRTEGATEDELAAVRALKNSHAQRALSIADLGRDTPVAASAAPVIWPKGASHVCNCNC